MSSSLRIFVAVIVAFGVATLQADDEKPAKKKSEVVKKEGETPTREKPAKEKSAKEKPEAVKKDGEKPTKGQPAKEKPETARKQPEKPMKEKPASEKKPEPPADKKPLAKTDAKQDMLVEAVVKNVHADKQALTVVLLKDGEKVEQNFAVEKDARFLIAGNKTASLSDVKPDMRVSLLMTEQKTVAGIKSGEGGRKGEIANGIVKAVDEARHSITITREGENAAQTFAVATNAKIAVAGGDGKLSDLKPGTHVAFMMAEEKKAIVVIKAVVKGEKDLDNNKKKEGSPKK